MPAARPVPPALRLALDYGPLLAFFAAQKLFDIFVATGVFMVAIVIVVWQLLYAAELKPHYVLPSPTEVGEEFAGNLGDPKFWSALGTREWMITSPASPGQ